MDAALVNIVLAELAGERSVFHSEADLQLAFGMVLATAVPDANVRLETRPWGSDQNWALDVEVAHGGDRVGIEMKYLVRALDADVEGERFILKTQSAHDLRRYDTVKDLLRVEDLVAERGFTRGHVIVVSNDPAYWKPPTGRSTLDAAFRIHEGAVLEGERAWWLGESGSNPDGPSPGTIKGREMPLVLRGRYPLAWADYGTVDGAKNGKFRFLVISCDAGTVASG